MARPATNRDGEWIVYHASTGAVEEHPPEEAKRKLDAGSHVVRPGGLASEWDPGPQWTLSMSPEEYLERYPDGPNAELAHEVLGHAAPEEEAAPEEPGDSAEGDEEE